jgi:hypothetical protein
MGMYGFRAAEVAANKDWDTDLGVEFAAEFPEINNVFRGVRADDGLSWQVWPATLNLFPGDGKLKFCISPKAGSKIAFGTVDDPTKGLGGVEAAIAAGHYEWKGRRAK